MILCSTVQLIEQLKLIRAAETIIQEEKRKGQEVKQEKTTAEAKTDKRREK